MNIKKRISFMIAMVIAVGGVLCAMPVNIEAKSKVIFTVTDGAEGTFYGKGTITLMGKPGYFSGTSGTNTERVSVWNNKGFDVTQDFKYDSSAMSDYIPYKFTPLSYGEYTVRYAHVSGGSQDYIKTATINIVNPKKAKNVKPAFTLKAKTSTVILSGFDNRASTCIYRATKKDGKYKLIKTVKADSYSDNSIKSGKNYFYRIKVKVKSGKKTYTTSKSKILAAYLGAPSKPTIKSIEIVDTKDEYDRYALCVTWDAKNYDSSVDMTLWYADDTSGGGSTIKTVNASNGKMTISLGNLPGGFTGNTYYFQLLAYRDNNIWDDDLCAKSKWFKYTVPDPYE